MGALKTRAFSVMDVMESAAQPVAKVVSVKFSNLDRGRWVGSVEKLLCQSRP
jgi:hypothetical protein